MNKPLLTLMAAGFMATSTGVITAANASPSYDEKVQCADGTVFKLNDAITAEAACEYHGGVSPSSVISANELTLNETIIPIPVERVRLEPLPVKR